MNKYFFMTVLFFLAYHLGAVEIVIRDGVVVNENPVEEKKPDLPSNATLSINVFNLTNFSAVIGVQASDKGSTTNRFIMQSGVAKNTSLTLGKFFSASPDTTFVLDDHYVYVNYDETFTQKLECSLKKSGEELVDSTTTIKKSVDIYIYTPKDTLPAKCVIQLDSNL